MFSANALPRPPFASEHRPLRLTSEAQRPLPAGECRFVLLHPSSSMQNQRCSCQSFHHNRSIPGSTCDCGHQACYHEHNNHHQEGVAGLGHGGNTSQQQQAAALVNRVRQLEVELRYERQLRQREVGVLREAVQPFFRNGEELRLKLIDIEDRVESNYDEQVRLKDRMVALDDASMAMERRLEDFAESTRTKRRRVASGSRPLQNGDLVDSTPWGSSDDHPTSLATSGGFATSRSISPPAARMGGESPCEEPRSSGVLNLVSLRSPPYVPPRAVSPPRLEARSSGFLALDLAERLASRAANNASSRTTRTMAGDQSAAKSVSPTTKDSYSQAGGMKAPPSVMTFVAPMANIELNETNFVDEAARKRKRSNEILPLDVLANVSAISPIAR